MEKKFAIFRIVNKSGSRDPVADHSEERGRYTNHFPLVYQRMKESRSTSHDTQQNLQVFHDQGETCVHRNNLQKT